MAKQDPQIKVQAGQVWKDNDPRGKGDTFLVINVVGDFVDVFRIASVRRTMIQLKRFRPISTGYTLQGTVDYLGVR